MDLNIVDLILQEFNPTSEEHERIKFYIETHKGDCDYYLSNSSKYKERLICLKSIFHSIKSDLLSDVCKKVYF